jgi:hypothetical protein
LAENGPDFLDHPQLEIALIDFLHCQHRGGRDVDDGYLAHLFCSSHFVIRAFICVFIVWTDSAAEYKIAWLVFVGAFRFVGETLLPSFRP